MENLTKSHDWWSNEINIWRTQLLKHKTSSSPPSQYVILLATGSFNPPHKLHVQMYEEAYKNLLKKEIAVIGCLLVPASDFYVKNKLGSGAVSYEHRSALLEMIYKESFLKELFAVSKAEAFYNHFYTEAVVFYQKLVKKEFPEDAHKIQIKYLCGSDTGNFLLYNSNVWSHHGTVVIERAGQPILPRILELCPWMMVFPGVESDVSSTALRNGGYENAHKYTVASAVEYMEKHNLLKKRDKW